MKYTILTTALLAIICWPASADSLYLRDGRVLQGTFMGGTSRDIRFLQNGGRTETYSLSSVDNVVFGNATGNNANSSSVFDESNRTNSRASDNRPYRDDTSRSRTVSGDNAVAAGSVVTVRMIDAIDSDKTSEGKTYRASLDDPIVVNGRTIADRGADATVRVVRVQQSGRITGNEEVQLVLSSLTLNGRTYPINSGPATVASKSKGSQSAKVIGGTAVVGAIIGAIAGGGKGAAIGAASGAGAGAAIQAIRGQRVQVPSESTLDFTLTDPIYLNQ